MSELVHNSKFYLTTQAGSWIDWWTSDNNDLWWQLYQVILFVGKKKKETTLKEWDGLQEFDATTGNTTFNYTLYWVTFNGVMNIFFPVLKKKKTMHI